jgi:hypothetical protein
MIEEQYRKDRAEMGMPDPDDYKSHNSSEEDERSPNLSKLEAPPAQVAETPKSVAGGKKSVMSNKKVEEKKEEAPAAGDTSPVVFKAKAGVPEIIIAQEKARQLKIRQDREEELSEKT